MHLYLIKHFLRVSVEGIISFSPFRVSLWTSFGPRKNIQPTPWHSTPIIKFPRPFWQLVCLGASCICPIPEFEFESESISAFPLSHFPTESAPVFVLVSQIDGPCQWPFRAFHYRTATLFGNNCEESPKKQSSLLLTRLATPAWMMHEFLSQL